MTGAFPQAPQPNPQGVPIMSTKQDKAPKWSEAEMAIAVDFGRFIAQTPDTDEEKSLRATGNHTWFTGKRNRLVTAFVKEFHTKHPLLKGQITNFNDLTTGVHSAMSHNAAKAKEEKKKRLAMEKFDIVKAGVTSEFDKAIKGRNMRFLTEHLHPDDFDAIESQL